MDDSLSQLHSTQEGGRADCIQRDARVYVCVRVSARARSCFDVVFTQLKAVLCVVSPQSYSPPPPPARNTHTLT